VDIDPEAVRAARENAQLNAVAERLEAGIGDGPPAGGNSDDERFDIVLANIFAEKLVAMRDRLTSCVKTGGYLILSGIDSTRALLIESAFVADSWHAIDCVAAGDWLTFLLRRGDSESQKRKDLQSE